ncbi:MAG TPA: alpha-N-arabinofuranosidase [Clostridiales bacterium]|nr:alpha-N-arabinofuranosidase [Clostridiales bacterium]HQK73622.1 alpha-N-arabinofuranosidase [Clostridiales bacterium]
MKKAKLTLDRDFVIGEVDPRLYGSFIEHLGRAVYGGIYEPGHPAADENGFRQDVLELVKKLNVPVVRYPGGNFVSGYDWHDGVGPRDQRPARLELAWDSTESNAFGTNEFIDWCRAAGAEPMLAVNLGLKGPEEARNLVEYCNHPGGTYWSDLRRAHGYEKPHGVKLWCLGNEMDGSWQIGAKTAYEYGRIATETAKVIKMTDRDAELIVCGSSNSRMPTFGDWETTVLDLAYDKVNYISLHQYFGFDGGDDQDGQVKNFLAKPLELEEYIKTVICICDAVKGKKHTKHTVNLSLDEWNVWYHSHGAKFEKWSRAPHILEDVYNFADTLVVGLMLIAMLRHCDRVKIACMAQLVNVIAPIMTDNGGSAWAQTIFYPLMQVSNYGRGTALLPVMETTRHDTKDFTDVPDCDAMCVFNEAAGELAVFAVNRDFNEPIQLDVKLTGFKGFEPFEYSVMAGYDLTAVNRRADCPVVPVPAPLPAVENGHMKVLLPPLSWNVIRLRG